MPKEPFKKRKSKKKLWIFITVVVALGTVLGYLESLGLQTGHSGDMFCGGSIVCEGYFWIYFPQKLSNQLNVTQICFGKDVKIQLTYPDKVSNLGLYKDSPTGWKKFNFSGGCIGIGNNSFMINATKDAYSTVKWTVEGTEIDPYWYELPKGFIGEFYPSNEIRIESQTYFGNYINFEFKEINNTHWLVNYSINNTLKNDIKNCLLSADKLSCFKNLCDIYLVDFIKSINASCNLTKQYIWNDVLKLTDWKLINLTENIKFDKASINYLSDGNFYIIFPNGFKERERASFGNPFDPQVTMIPNSANGTTYNGTIAETTHPAITAGTSFVDASYNLVNTSNNQYARTTGSATVDAYVRTNFYLPQSIYYLDWIYVTVELKNTANLDALHLALYNYTSGSFLDVNTTASSTTDKNLSFNISGSNITQFVDYRTMNVLTHLSGTSADNLDVDYISALVAYTNPNSPVVINTGTTTPWLSNTRNICRDASGNLHVIWSYNTTHLYYANSSDGTAWNLNTTFRGGTSTAASVKDPPSISCNGNNITVSYIDQISDDVIVGYSINNGASWSWTSIAEVDLTGEAVNERRGLNIYLAYRNGTSANRFILFRKSTNGGTSFSASVKIIGGTNFMRPSIAVNGTGGVSDIIHVIAVDASITSPFSADIWYTNSSNSGSTWTLNKSIANPSLSVTTDSITCDGTNLYVTGYSTSEIWFTNSTNGGGTWTTYYSIDKSTAPNRTLNPSVTLDNNNYPRVLWEQNTTNANYDIVYRSHNGTAWNDTETYLTNNNLGNTWVNTPWTYYSDNKIHYIYRNGTASLFQIMYDYISLVVPDTQAPTYSLNSTNSTAAGTPISHNLYWYDNQTYDTGLSGYIFQFCNGTWNGTNCLSNSCVFTITLNETNGGNVGDSYVDSYYATTNYGTETYLTIDAYSGEIWWSYLLWNLSVIPSGSTITNANLSLYMYQADPDASHSATAYNTSNSWTEANITWNNKTIASKKQGSTISTGTTADVRLYWNVTNATIHQFAQSNKNLSIMINDSVSTVTTAVQFGSKEYATVSQRPQLVITYTASGTCGWINDSFVSMIGATNWSNVTKVVNSTTGANIAWCVYANDTSNNWNGTSCVNPFSYLTTTEGGVPDINVSYGPSNTNVLIVDLNSTGAGCGPDYISYWVEPENQTTSFGIYNATNNGTATGDFQARLSGNQNIGWIIMLSNSSSTSNTVNLTTSYQTIWNDVSQSAVRQIWAYFNCTNINIAPGVEFQWQAIT